MITSLNFEFLENKVPELVKLGALAERYFNEDPPTSIVKVRQFAEMLAKLIAARQAAFDPQNNNFDQILRRLSYDRIISRDVADLFHAIRKLGNAAAHDNKGTHADALCCLRYARSLGAYFVQVYCGQAGFRLGPFVPPSPPIDASKELKAQIDELRSQLEKTQQLAISAHIANESAAEQIARERREREEWQRLAIEAEAERVALENKIVEIQQQASTATPTQLAEFVEAGVVASSHLDLDEAATRVIIDGQLRDRGWEADTKTIRYANGSRPIKGKNLAIAEWPTNDGPADYALFCGLELVAFVEAKRKRKNVSSAIDQAERYSKGFKGHQDVSLIGGPWGEHSVPFVFATNGRAYLRQIETESGIWFRDTRSPNNHRRALKDWPTPKGILSWFEVDEKAAQDTLKNMPFNFGFALRPYQEAAIKKVEEKLDAGVRSMLVAMATGTGKTKLAIAMLYRLLASKRFRRICFVVDRSALGVQTEDEFTATKVVSGKTFSDIFGLQGLEQVKPDDDAKVHICTIQGLVKRVLYANSPEESPSIDQYDLMVIDECHRGYLLDRELSDAELSFRDQTDYVSKYRAILDYFDAVKIGLTATPALHTAEIFGDPIFRYSYREAVVDGFLIDHEPPIRFETVLKSAGIVFDAGESVEVYNTKTGVVDTIHTPDEIKFEVENFNRQVLTENFNRVVAQELANYIDPTLPDKTLIFAANDRHADLVVKVIKEAFKEAYGEIEDAAVRKITGSVDKVKDLIRAYRNDTNPKIAVTVDLLTTGVDVPKITNLVFLRRVNSRILYEQMIGRATRKCDEINKEVFRIFDPVDLYQNLQDVTDMKPIVVKPNIGFDQLIKELQTVENTAHQEEIKEQLIVKLRRKLRHLKPEAREKFENQTGLKPEDLLNNLQSQSIEQIKDWLKKFPQTGQILDWQPEDNSPNYVAISHHEDELIGTSRGYGEAQKPEDYLENFHKFVSENINKIDALKLVVQRPRELTRATLRELKMELDRSGYSEANLKTAWSQAKNEDIAASIIGYVRQAALGDPLIPYEDRVRGAMRKIKTSKQWTEPQKRWLDRIGEQVTKEIVIDREALDRDPFINDGGFNRLNKIFGGELETIIANINETMWGNVG